MGNRIVTGFGEEAIARCPLRPQGVNSGLYRQPHRRSAHPPEADENYAKADLRVRMSAVGGEADVARRWLELPLIARSRSSPGSNSCVRNDLNRPTTAIHDRWRERRLWDRKAVVRVPRSVRQLIAIIGHLLSRLTGGLARLGSETDTNQQRAGQTRYCSLGKNLVELTLMDSD